MFLGVSTQGSDWYDDFQNIAFHLPLWDNIRGNIRRRPTLTFLVWIVIILTKTWLLSKRAQIVLFIYMSNMSNKQMAQSDTKHSNIGEKLLTTTFLFCFFGQNHQFELFAILQISGLWHLNILPSWWNVILITSSLSQKSFCKTLFFYNMTHSQMLGKFEYTSPAKFWRLVGCTEMLSW